MSIEVKARPNRGVYKVFIPCQLWDMGLWHTPIIDKYMGADLVAFFDGAAWHEIAIGDICGAYNAPPMPGVSLMFGDEVVSRYDLSDNPLRVYPTITAEQIQDGPHVVHSRTRHQPYSATPQNYPLQGALFIGKSDKTRGFGPYEYVQRLAEHKTALAVFLDGKQVWHYDRGYSGEFAHLN
jgi:hypothetical protein